jgi:hypothetical protein
LKINKKIVSSHTTDSKPVKQEVNGTVILPPLVFPGFTHKYQLQVKVRESDTSTGLINANCQINYSS